MKKYKIVVSDNVSVKVSGSLLNKDGKQEPFKFNLLCRRADADALKEIMLSEGSIKDAVADCTIGWSGQRLVLEDDNTPAEFCPEALDALLSIPSMALLCWNAYCRDTGAQAKN